MHQGFLSDIELYYSDEADAANGIIVISGDEAHHASNVMRHSNGEVLFVTDGNGSIFKSEITEIKKNAVTLKILQTLNYKNEFENIWFCIPRLKNKDRFEFAVEKCIELGITNFIVFESDRTVSKGDKTDKWIKMGISAMKQSIRSFLPVFRFENSIDDIAKKYTNNECRIFMFDQKAEHKFSGSLNDIQACGKDLYFIFGPEGGISERELYLLKEAQFLCLTGNRLRSETAVISAAILLTQE